MNRELYKFQSNRSTETIFPSQTLGPGHFKHRKNTAGNYWEQRRPPQALDFGISYKGKKTATSTGSCFRNQNTLGYFWDNNRFDILVHACEIRLFFAVNSIFSLNPCMVPFLGPYRASNRRSQLLSNSGRCRCKFWSYLYCLSSPFGLLESILLEL